MPCTSGQLVLYAVPEWSYSRQQLIPAHDERRLLANRREQERYGGTVIDFYQRSALAYDVRVHRVEGGGGHHRIRELDIVRLVELTLSENATLRHPGPPAAHTVG